MTRYTPPFEIHVHGEVPLRDDVDEAQISEALKPLWAYAGARSMSKGASSFYEEEPGIQIKHQEGVLQLCWTVPGDENFRHVLDDVCMGLNEVAAGGAALEITFYDTEFEQSEETEEDESRDDFLIVFVGPTPAAIMQVQRDLLIEDVVHLMERHFDGSELNGVVDEIDKLFAQRFDDLVNSLELGKPPRGSGGGSNGGSGGGSHGGGRRPRHLH